MASAEFPWEPPIAGTESEHLVGALDRLRTTFRWKADGLDDDGVRATVGVSILTIGSLLKHLAFVEAFYARLKLAGESPGAPWETIDWDANPGWDFTSAGDDSAEDLYALYDGAVARAREIYAGAIADGGLDQIVNVDDGAGRPPSLRRLLFDLVEEYGRHTGHADLLREVVDGRVGEGPRAGWTAGSGSYRLPRGGPWTG